MIAIWMLAEWERAGSPKRVRLLELGPGTGILTQQLLHVSNNILLFS